MRTSTIRRGSAFQLGCAICSRGWKKVCHSHAHTPRPIASQLRASARCALGRNAIEQNRRGVIKGGSGGQAVKNHSFQALPKTPLSCQPPLFSAVPAVAAVGLVHPAQK